MTFLFTSQHELFIKRMLENEEQEKKGYEILLTKEYFAEFFDHLQAAGLFDENRTPGPQPATAPGSFWIPYWAPLDYLEACARLAGEKSDAVLANKILVVVRACSTANDSDGIPRHNYHTARKFAEILGLLPTPLVQINDIDFIQRWLSDPYDRGLVCSALDKGLMNGLLNSTVPEDWSKAVRILYHCTELVKGDGDDQYRTIVDDYWLKELIDNHSSKLGEKAGSLTTAVFIERLSQIFGAGTRKKHGYLFRPAIEDHPQNKAWHGPEDRCVEGLRDVLLSWASLNPTTAKDAVKSLLHGELEIARRVAIHVVNHRWGDLKELLEGAIDPELFQSGHLHELYQLLSAHFQEMEPGQQALVLDAIDQVSIPETTDNPGRLRRIVQRNWLSALQGKGNERADQWFTELGQGEDAVGVSSHPDFHSYMESSWSEGPSIYQPEELLAFAQSGTIVDVLNDFTQTDRWNGPTTRALVSTLEAVVPQDTELFIRCLPSFLHAKRPYQYGILNGLKQAWENSAKDQGRLDWDLAWSVILGFVFELISPDSFWAEQVEPDADFCPSRDWIPPIVADFLRAGTRDDAHAYPSALLSSALVLIEILLAYAEASPSPSEDPMNMAINSPKGKAVEALFSHALRQCRVSDQVSGGHVESWASLQPIFDKELDKTKGQNFEFSTLAAAYLSNLQYLSEPWLVRRIRQIFPIEFPDSFNSAIGGLAYSEATKVTYRLLIDAGVIDAALRQYDGKTKLEERLIERVALAYLWGDEELDSPRFSWWFEHSDMDALTTASHFFWSVSKHQLKEEQVTRIMQFWQRCIDVVQRGGVPADQLLSSLSRLTCYVGAIGTSEEALLTPVAPYAHVGYNSDWFIEELERLADGNPHAVSRLLNFVLDAHEPIFDFEDRLKSIARKFAEHQMRDEALQLIDRLRRLKGMAELFDELSTARQSS